MKSLHSIMFVALMVLLVGCQQQPQTVTDEESTSVRKEVMDRFNQLVSAINQKNAKAWSGYYSQDNFISTFAGTDYYDSRSAWVDLITNYFQTRESQQMRPLAVRVNELKPDLALLTSTDKTEMRLSDGQNIKAKHVFTMLWKKEQGGWKIIHSHESWVDDKTI